MGVLSAVERGRMGARARWLRERPLEEDKVEGIERELRVIRVGPNPKLVTCEYYELAERRVCVVNVKRNALWLKGMRFRMVEPKAQELYEKPWEYRGPGPRRRGRW